MIPPKSLSQTGREEAHAPAAPLGFFYSKYSAFKADGIEDGHGAIMLERFDTNISLTILLLGGGKDLRASWFCLGWGGRGVVFASHIVFVGLFFFGLSPSWLFSLLLRQPKL